MGGNKAQDAKNSLDTLANESATAFLHSYKEEAERLARGNLLWFPLTRHVDRHWVSVNDGKGLVVVFCKNLGASYASISYSMEAAEPVGELMADWLAFGRYVSEEIGVEGDGWLVISDPHSDISNMGFVQAVHWAQRPYESYVRPSIMYTNSYFVAHEFSREKMDDLRRAIAEALEDTGLKPYSADEEVREGQIFKDKILPAVGTTKLGIYDISNSEKPKVFVELGAAISSARKASSLPRTSKV